MSPVMPPMPIEAFLTPETTLASPAGFARSRQELTRGVPFQWPLDSDVSLVLFVPTGVAAMWRELDPSIVVSSSLDEIRPHESPRGADPQEHPPLRLLLRHGRATLAAIPLAAGLSRVTPDGDSARTIIDLLILEWLLHAGCVRGPGDYGSFINVAWRRAEQGANVHALAPIHPHVAERNPALSRSTIGISGANAKPRGGYLP